MSTHHGIFIHAVFSTKFRVRVLRDSLREELFAYIAGMLHEHKSTLLIAGGIEDHVHLLLKIHPSFALSNTMQFIKSNSSRWINEGRRIDAKFEWQSGYEAFSVSQSMIDTVYKYISNQAEHHRTMSFEEEYLQTHQKHHIEFDPKYVFESEHVGERICRRVATPRCGGDGDQGSWLLRNLTPGSDYDIASRLGWRVAIGTSFCDP